MRRDVYRTTRRVFSRSQQNICLQAQVVIVWPENAHQALVQDG
jgi:hypothetical protein